MNGGEPIPGAGGQTGTGNEAPAAPEKSEEQQKLDALVDKVREVNAQLGGKVAAEVQFGSGRLTLFFAKRNITPPAVGICGVDSTMGAVYITGELSEKLAGHDGVDLTKVPSVTEEEVRGWVHPVQPGQLEYWQNAFEESKRAVLEDQSAMRRLRQQRMGALDQALNVVSKPIDINVPPPVGPAP
jgi:hypothetical protein